MGIVELCSAGSRRFLEDSGRCRAGSRASCDSGEKGSAAILRSLHTVKAGMVWRSSELGLLSDSTSVDCIALGKSFYSRLIVPSLKMELLSLLLRTAASGGINAVMSIKQLSQCLGLCLLPRSLPVALSRKRMFLQFS